ncbi:MAG: rRNA maturation RNase YbeY [Hydrotalea sp.]|nr:rRNA maturation RNase YbeY [Hydrotalea sp.]
MLAIFNSFASLFSRFKIIIVRDAVAWRDRDIYYLLWQLRRAHRQIPNAPKRAAIEILFTDDKQMKKLKKDFLHSDKATNVLSFPNHHRHDTKDIFLGSIALGHGVINREARAMQKTFRNHLTHLGIHGLLHLLDFDHQQDSEADAMERLEISILSRIGIGDPYQ